MREPIYPAFARWFVKETKRDVDSAVSLFLSLMNEPQELGGEFLWGYLDQVGDVTYTAATFRKAVQLIFEEADLTFVK